MNKNLLLFSLFELKILLEIKESEQDPDILEQVDDEIENHNEFFILLKKRQEARESRNYELADSIRTEFKNAGIEIKDKEDKTVINVYFLKQPLLL